MRKLILKMSVTIDNFVALPNGEQPWIQRTGIEDQESAAWTLAAIRAAGTHLMGHHTFEDMASYWPYSTQAFAAPMNVIPKVVFAHGTIDPAVTKRAPNAEPKTTPSAAALASWHEARVVSGPVAEEIAKLKQESGGPIIAYGGAAFAQSLVRENLPDELQLLVHPIAIGRGLPLFSKLEAPLELELVDVKRFPLGGVAHVYRKRA
jgi:dihydrofolate reductase